MEGGVILTSNRDESVARPAAAEPRIYQEAEFSLLYPKDGLKGGSWFVVSGRGHIGVLLNGARQAHCPSHRYTRSRGIILVRLMAEADPLQAFCRDCYGDVEPFTIVLFSSSSLYQLRWDGREKMAIEKDRSQAHIWSSSTLYDADAKEHRANLFAEFMEGDVVTAKGIRAFHAGSHHPENGFVMRRTCGVTTQSITQALWVDSGQVQLHYHDLQTKLTSLQSLHFSAV